jgi:hypothetical protein
MSGDESATPTVGIARCHCGGVEIEARFPSRFVAHCYCASCRITHAAGVVTWIGFKAPQVRYTRGAEMVRDYVSSPGTRRKFCTACGTRLAYESDREQWAGEVHLPLALFVTPVDRSPHVNAFAAERARWAPFNEFHG